MVDSPEMELDAIMNDEFGAWKPIATSTPRAIRKAPVKDTAKLRNGYVSSFTRKQDLSQVTEKLARFGVTITSKGILQPKFPEAATPKKRTGVTCSSRYHPLIVSPVSVQKDSFETPMARNEFGSIRRMQARILFSECQKTAESFLCNFCNELFDSREDLKRHHGVHGITYLELSNPRRIDYRNRPLQYVSKEGNIVIDLTK